MFFPGRKYPFIAAAIVAAMVFSSCARKEYVQISGYAQGGTYSITCKCLPSEAQSLKSGADSILSIIDASVSGYNPASLLSRRNNGEDLPDDGSAEYNILEELSWFCDSLYRATGGALDTRSGALFDIWGFGFRSGWMPSAEEVEAAMSNRRVQNFNCVAQGWSCDMVGQYLLSRGVEDFLVNVGGEILCSGLNPKGSSWTIAIDTPVDGNDTPGKNISGVFTVPSGQRRGVVTSGNYRKFYFCDGVKYPHTIDPRTGYPVHHSLLSATVIARNAALADAIATYCMVIGPTAAREFILSRDDLEAVLISDGDIWKSFE